MPACVLVVDDSTTIRRVVTSILERRGYETMDAADGMAAMELLGEKTADLVLVDFVMPKMNGFQFCRALRSEERFRSTPVVLMSATSDRIRQRFVEQTGALDALAKPFDAQALVAVVENALRRVQEGRAEPPAPMTEDEFVEPEATIPPEEMDETTARVRFAGVLVLKIAERLHGFMGKTQDDLVGELADRIPPPIAREIVAAVREAEGGVILAGVMPTIPVGAVLHVLEAEALSGLLVMTSEGTEITATFRDGLVDLVESKGGGTEFRLGRYLVEDGILTQEELTTLLETEDSVQRGRRKAPLGARLSRDGRVTPEQIARALSRQSSELIYEVLRWKKGRFEFRKERAASRASDARLGLSVATLLVEGIRRVEEWRYLETTLGDFDATLVREVDAVEKLDVKALPKAEQAVFALVDGEKTVREVVLASGSSSFDVCRILVQFLGARMLRRRAS